MPRQTFLTKETFFNASEQHVKQVVYSLPEVLPELTFLADNKLIEQIRFTYQAGEKCDYVVDLSVLTVNDQYCRLSIHAAHKNGKAFVSDPEMHLVIHEIEAAVQATLKGEVYPTPQQVKIKETRNANWMNTFKGSLALLVMKKKFS